jgi:hypothetical protein
MSLASPLVHCLKLTRSKSILSRFAVPITLAVINTFMMSTSAEGADNFKSFSSMPTKICDLASPDIVVYVYRDRLNFDGL